MFFFLNFLVIELLWDSLFLLVISYNQGKFKVKNGSQFYLDLYLQLQFGFRLIVKTA